MSGGGQVEKYSPPVPNLHTGSFLPFLYASILESSQTRSSVPFPSLLCSIDHTARKTQTKTEQYPHKPKLSSSPLQASLPPAEYGTETAESGRTVWRNPAPESAGPHHKAAPRRTRAVARDSSLEARRRARRAQMHGRVKRRQPQGPGWVHLMFVGTPSRGSQSTLSFRPKRSGVEESGCERAIALSSARFLRAGFALSRNDIRHALRDDSPLSWPPQEPTYKRAVHPAGFFGVFGDFGVDRDGGRCENVNRVVAPEHCGVSGAG